ncbi:hypothetical protein ACOMHN_001714 [Nucella lapillus]
MATDDIISKGLPTVDYNITDLFLNVTSKTEPSQCLVLNTNAASTLDNPDSVVSTETEDLVRRMRDIVILPILFLIGGPANVINMAVFLKQGLKERINVCLFSLSLADFLYLLFNMVMYGERIEMQFTTEEKYGPIARFMSNHNMLGFYGFTWVSEIISAIIASERCFCVLQPLRSQTVLSTSTTTITITLIFIIILGLNSIVATRYRSVCAYIPPTDTYTWAVIPSQFYFDHHQLVDSLDAFVFGVGIPVVMMLVVMVTTIITVVKLRKQAAWRAGTASSGSSVSAREVALTMMLVYNSTFFIVCVFPLALFRIVWLFIPELRVGRSQHNLFFMCLWLLDMVSYVNAAFNIVVYYTMGSRYRQTLWGMLSRGSKTDL